MWFLAAKVGTVRAAHCDCTAELCEACSHVGAVLLLWSLVLELEIPPLAHKKKANGCSACSTNPAKPAEKGCIKSLQRFLPLRHHLDVGRHSYALENETLFDKAITSFATKLEQGTATVENPVEDIEACQALNSCSSLPKG